MKPRIPLPGLGRLMFPGISLFLVISSAAAQSTIRVLRPYGGRGLANPDQPRVDGQFGR